jgi:hypothetical protein
MGQAVTVYTRFEALTDDNCVVSVPASTGSVLVGIDILGDDAFAGEFADTDALRGNLVTRQIGYYEVNGDAGVKQGRELSEEERYWRSGVTILDLFTLEERGKVDLATATDRVRYEDMRAWVVTKAHAEEGKIVFSLNGTLLAARTALDRAKGAEQTPDAMPVPTRAPELTEDWQRAYAGLVARRIAEYDPGFSVNILALDLKDFTGDGMPELLLYTEGAGASGGLEIYVWEDGEAHAFCNNCMDGVPLAANAVDGSFSTNYGLANEDLAWPFLRLFDEGWILESHNAAWPADSYYRWYRIGADDAGRLKVEELISWEIAGDERDFGEYYETGWTLNDREVPAEELHAARDAFFASLMGKTEYYVRWDGVTRDCGAAPDLEKFEREAKGLLASWDPDAPVVVIGSRTPALPPVPEARNCAVEDTFAISRDGDDFIISGTGLGATPKQVAAAYGYDRGSLDGKLAELEEGLANQGVVTPIDEGRSNWNDSQCPPVGGGIRFGMSLGEVCERVTGKPSDRRPDFDSIQFGTDLANSYAGALAWIRFSFDVPSDQLYLLRITLISDDTAATWFEVYRKLSEQFGEPVWTETAGATFSSPEELNAMLEDGSSAASVMWGAYEKTMILSAGPHGAELSMYCRPWALPEPQGEDPRIIKLAEDFTLDGVPWGSKLQTVRPLLGSRGVAPGEVVEESEQYTRLYQKGLSFFGQNAEIYYLFTNDKGDMKLCAISLMFDKDFDKEAVVEGVSSVLGEIDKYTVTGSGDRIPVDEPLWKWHDEEKAGLKYMHTAAFAEDLATGRPVLEFSYNGLWG